MWHSVQPAWMLHNGAGLQHRTGPCKVKAAWVLCIVQFPVQRHRVRACLMMPPGGRMQRRPFGTAPQSTQAEAATPCLEV